MQSNYLQLEVKSKSIYSFVQLDAVCHKEKKHIKNITSINIFIIFIYIAYLFYNHTVYSFDSSESE